MRLQGRHLFPRLAGGSETHPYGLDPLGNRPRCAARMECVSAPPPYLRTRHKLL
jgi:hypothetical protein